ncbi:alpha/beta fold hydrolase [Nocardia macrotermitis]|uniref:2-succinyl-6-hydroxy-2, 4-cyclohexadiene-1-carboxylate synthase n=1 Tax=Nocardia macrotermitis TaxID=2585198 RepID=A0A7K0D607_9NOCA|nr:alpha/beta fold hydrolase [Nocardia macrotermitis]MQY20722.1 2-succinyl-6-hydroxy-2,4-cyclohexadiene-1-carboxylate synthase [Nocardia macrotermitis]
MTVIMERIVERDAAERAPGGHAEPPLLPVTRTGFGQPVIFCHGVGETQDVWRHVIAELGEGFEAITFDLPGHGKSTATGDYTFEAFRAAVRRTLSRLIVREPILVGWSLGADLVLDYAATYPVAVAGLVLVDGAVPLDRPLARYERRTHRSRNGFGIRGGSWLARRTPERGVLPPDALAELTRAIDRHRRGLLRTYCEIACPTTMILSTEGTAERGTPARHVGAVRHTGAERLRDVHPDISLTRVTGGADLPFTHAADIADAVVGTLVG